MRPRSLPALTGAAALAVAIGGCGASQTASAHTATDLASISPPASPAALTTSRSSVVDGWGFYAGNNRPDGGAPGSTDAAAGGSGSGAGTRSTKRQHRHNAGSTGSGTRANHLRFSPQQIAGIPGKVVQIATSNSDSYALTSRGAVYAVGAGLAGELGDGATPKLATRAVRVHLPAGVRIARLSNPMPYDAGMVIDTQGRVWAWGNDANQEFCQSREANLDTPVEVPLAHVSLAVGAQRHAIYDAGGRIVSCGLGADGQLGNGSSGASSQTGRPVAVQGLPAGRVRALTSGYGNAGVLMADGAYYDWGLNNHGQVGDGTRAMATRAVRVKLPGAVRQISEGGSITSNGQAMAILTDGQLWEWGAGSAGQMGNGSTADQLSPIRLSEPAGVRFVSVNSGGATDFAISQTGQLWDWGANAEGQLGIGSRTTVRATRPVRTSLAHVSQVSSTAANVEALLAR